MYDQRKEWESLVFDATQKSDPNSIRAYLSSLFASTGKAKKLTKTPIEAFRTTMKEFELGKFDLDSLKWCIKGLLRVDLLSPSKRAALSDINNNDLVLVEMVDVLNIQLDNLDQWSWGDQPVSVDLRRQVNGKYRVYMDEEILQAILIHFIGLKWPSTSRALASSSSTLALSNSRPTGHSTERLVRGEKASSAILHQTP